MRNVTHVKGIINQKTMKLVGIIGPRKGSLGFLSGRVGDILPEMPEVGSEIEVVGAVHILGFDDSKKPMFSDPYRKKYRVTAITPYTCYVEPLKGEKHA